MAWLLRGIRYRMEGALVISIIAQKWKLQMLPARRVQHQALITLRPKFGVHMRLERRAASM